MLKIFATMFSINYFPQSEGTQSSQMTHTLKRLTLKLLVKLSTTAPKKHIRFAEHVFWNGLARSHTLILSTT